MEFLEKALHSFEYFEISFELIIKILVLLIEVVGTIILIHAIVTSIVGLFNRQKHARLKLAEGISLALEFKMGAEVLRSVVAKSWNEIGMLAAIVAIRAAMVLLLHWEIKHERKSGNMTDEELHDIKTPLTQDLEPQNKKNKSNKDNKDDKTEE